MKVILTKNDFDEWMEEHIKIEKKAYRKKYGWKRQLENWYLIGIAIFWTLVIILSLRLLP